MSIDSSTHDSLIKARDAILEALLDEMKRRSRNPNTWETRERTAVVIAANKYAYKHKLKGVTTDDVLDVERLAVGHTDYALKLALYVAELIHGLSVTP